MVERRRFTLGLLALPLLLLPGRGCGESRTPTERPRDGRTLSGLTEADLRRAFDGLQGGPRARPVIYANPEHVNDLRKASGYHVVATKRLDVLPVEQEEGSGGS